MLVQAAQLLLVRHWRDQFAVWLRECHIAFHRDQAARLRQPVQRLAQILADHAADLIGMLHHVVQRAVLGEPFHRGLRADLLHARHVVHRVAHQRQIIDDALRRHAEFGVHARDIQCLVAHRVDQHHALVHQLREILVAGGDHAAYAVLRLLRQRADHVVRLDTVQHQDIPAGGGNGLMQRFDLLREVGWHRGAMRLVFGIQVVAEGFAFCIEYARAIIRRVILAQAAQHVEHAVDRSGGFAVAVAQIGHRMECAIQER